MVVYLDSLIVLNTVMDYLLLLASARLTGAPFSRLRLGAGALLGGLYAALPFLPGGGWTDHPLCRLAAALLMVLAAFGGQPRLLRALLIFLGLSAAFAGGLFAIALISAKGSDLSPLVFPAMTDLRMILLSAALCYALFTLVFRRMGRHTAAAGEILPAVLTLGGRRVSFPVLIDTGNTLTDPASGRPVLVAEGMLTTGLFPDGPALSPALLSSPASALDLLSRGDLRGRLRLIPYRAVGVEHGLLLALRLDSLQVGVHQYGAALVALSPTGVSDGGAYGGLIGGPH